MTGEGNCASSGDNTNGSQSKEAPSLPVLSHDIAKSSQERNSPSASLQQNDTENILEIPNEEDSSEEGSSPSDSPGKPGSTLSSPQHSNDSLEAKLDEDADQSMKDILRKPSQRRKGRSDTEWTFYPSYCDHTYHTGKKCFFDGRHLRTKTSASERTLEMCLGKKKYATEIDSRNGIPMVTPGDQPYACPEQSRDFYKMGSSMPPVNFGSVTYIKKADTFIPLQHLPAVPCVPFHVKEKQQALEREKLEVKNLDLWKPAPSLMQTLYVAGLGRRMTYQPY